MDGNSYVLDTVIVVAYLNHDPIVLRYLQNSNFVVPSIVIGELFFGAYKSERVTTNVQQIRDFMTRNTILSCDGMTGNYYGQIKMQLRSRGRPIPDNDIWIAATAMQYGLSLATRDKHFREIEGLSLVMW